MAPEQSFCEYRLDEKSQREHVKGPSRRTAEGESNQGKKPTSSCEVSLPGLQLLSPWRREVLKRTPTTENDLSLLSGVSSLHSSHFQGRGTHDGSQNGNRCLQSRGQLNINVEVCEGFLKVFVGGVKNIRRHDLMAPCYFVLLSMIPQDNDNVNTLVTSMKHEHDPVFDEVFHITSNTTSGRHRLLIEVMSIGKDHRRRLIGCMSFGIRPLLAQRKSISGWYSLLNNEIGRRKHFKVQDPEMTPGGHNTLIQHKIPCDHYIDSQKPQSKSETQAAPRPLQFTGARCILGQTSMGPVTGSVETLDFTARSRHDLTVSSTHSSTCSEHQHVRGHHHAGSRNSSRTSDDNTSGYSTCSSGLSTRVKDYAYDDHQPTCLDDDFYDDEGPSDNWSFLAAFDNFRPEDTTTYSAISFRKREESRMYWQAEFI